MLGITTSGIAIENMELIHVLKENKISIIDCSLTNLLKKDWDQITDQDLDKLSYEYQKNSIKVNSIQSIFYNKKINFSNKSDLNDIISHLKILCKYAKILKCKKLLFGSPKQREDIGSFKNFINTFNNINNLMIDNDILFNIENLDYQNNILLKTPTDILNFIEINNLNKCKINLHLFIEEQNIDLNLLNNLLIDTIHFSNRNYTDLILDQEFDLLKSMFIKTRINKINKIIEINSNKINYVLKNVSNLFTLL